jgi:hypothetical protein
MVLYQDFAELAKTILTVLVIVAFASRWVYFRMFTASHPKEFIRFRLITPYSLQDVYATGSSSKRIFMTNSNRMLYLLLVLTGLLGTLLVIPRLV